MKGDIIFRAHGKHESSKPLIVGDYSTREQALEAIDRRKDHFRNLANNASEFDKSYWIGWEWDIEEIVVDTDFELPDTEKPIDKWTIFTTRVSGEGRHWDTSSTMISDSDGKEFYFERNYSGFPNYPFRKLDKSGKVTGEYMLASLHYTGTSVIDLSNGEVIASEEPDSFGFCPVGFYVPDYYDVHDTSVLPGSQFWDEDNEWPLGDFGFVWGCVWADDWSWKVQYLDLSNIENGEIKRDDRFGYISLASIGDDPRQFLRVGERTVTIAIEHMFKLDGTEITY